MFEPGEDVDIARPALVDQRPGQLQFFEIVLGAAKDLPAGVRKVGGVRVPEAVDTHIAAAPRSEDRRLGIKKPICAPLRRDVEWHPADRTRPGSGVSVKKSPVR